MKPTTKLLALAAPALLLWSAPSRADTPASTPIVVTAAPVSPAAVAGFATMAHIMRAIVTATQATAPSCDANGRPLAGNVGKAMPDHTCSMSERFTYALARETATDVSADNS
jgi:hypothetical protein